MSLDLVNLVNDLENHFMRDFLIFGVSRKLNREHSLHHMDTDQYQWAYPKIRKQQLFLFQNICILFSVSFKDV